MAVTFYFCIQDFHYLTGILEFGMAQDVEHTVIAQLLLTVVLCLVQSVAIDEERTPFDGCDLLADELQPGPEADGGIGLHLEE
jgi:hypothetical protein